ncbi:MAG: TIM barrel protein [Methanocorpusculum sp.]|nr:TIM barrel protein [Methanocorpusculum sp.]
MYSLCASCMFFHEHDPPEIFSAMKAANLDSLEFWMESPNFWLRGADTEELRFCKQNFQKLFPIAVHAPVFDLNPCSFNPKVAELSGYYSIKSMQALSELGGGVMTIHPGKRTAKRPISPTDKKRFEEYLKTIEKNLEDNVKVALENMPPAINAHMTTPAEIRKVLDEHSWLYFTFDYAHAQLLGEPMNFIDECSDRMVNIHSSLGRSDKMHTPLKETKEGELLKQKLSDTHYGGLVTFEFEDLNIGRNLSYEEKIKLLSDECRYFRTDLY